MKMENYESNARKDYEASSITVKPASYDYVPNQKVSCQVPRHREDKLKAAWGSSGLLRQFSTCQVSYQLTIRDNSGSDMLEQLTSERI